MSMHLTTRLTERFGLKVPIVSAPMFGAGPAALAAAVSEAGGLGLIAGAYGHGFDLEVALAEAGSTPVGIGFITWSLAKRPALLEQALKRKPRAVMLSFGDPAPFAPAIKAAGVPLICQCQTLAHVKEALAAGAAVVVAQGSEAGGHGGARGTMSLVAEAADHLRAHSPDTLLLAAGGIADGRGLAAALMLGADGVLMGSRFWASIESGVPQPLLDAAIAADGDATVHTSVPDIARGLEWPPHFKIRTLETGVIRDWSARQDETRADPELRQQLADRYLAGAREGDPENTGVTVGQAVGLIHDRPSAKVLVKRIADEAVERLSGASTLLSPQSVAKRARLAL